MSKYKHNHETLVVLEDLENRITQLIEANDRFKDSNPDMVAHQRTALESCRTLVKQCIDNGHVFRGSDFVPDGLLQYVKTPSPQETLIKAKS